MIRTAFSRAVGLACLAPAYYYTTTSPSYMEAATTTAASGEKAIKGSFLLVSTKDFSEAAKAAKSAGGNVDKNTKNDEVGKALIAIRDKQLGPNVSVFYKQDGGLVVTSGTGSHLRDIDGNLHLDCCNNVACVGHAHPRVVAAGQQELAKIQTNGRFLNPVQQRYLDKLLKTLPSELNTVYLVNSGSEANDLALRIARAHAKSTRAHDVLILDSAYHGHTQSLVDISPYKWYQAVDGKNYKPSSTHVLPCPDSYRGKYPFGQSAFTATMYAKEVEELVKDENGGGIGVFIAEAIVGCGGQVVPPPTYFQQVYDTIRKHGGVCIMDEVQTGFARTGTHFWMFQRHNVIPDILTVGKPMGNGYPVAAVICRREVAESFAASGIEYFNTYGGNSVACAIAEAVLDTIHEEHLQENALVVGDYLTKRMSSLLGKYRWVGNVRGVGLFQGIEFVKDANAAVLEPYPELTKFLVDYLKYQRVIVSRDGPDGNVIKIKPPLVFSKDNVDTLVNALDQALTCANELGLF